MQPDNLFRTPQGDFLLNRLPKRKHELLRAWDASDELLLNHLASEITLTDNTRILILNDNFGALTTALHNNHLTNWSDSYISHLAAQANLANNNLTTDKLTLLNSLETPGSPVNLVLIRIPKNLSLLEDQLIKLKPLLTADTQMIAGGMIKNISNNTWKLFERLTGPTSTSLAKKKARLIFIQPDTHIKPVTSPYPVKYQLENTPYTLSNHANVFSRDSLDIGTRFFLQHLPENKSYRTIIDLGCGNGVLGIMMRLKHPDTSIYFFDESYMAIASAKENFRTITGDTDNASFNASDCLTEATEHADLVLCNPPFHQNNTVSNHIAIRMFNQAYQQLNKGGELWVIGNRHLKYHHDLKRIFANCRNIASNNKFCIYASLK